MRHHPNKNINAVLIHLVKEGWTVEKGKKCLKLRTPLGRLVSISLTPSCPFVVQHILGDIRQMKQRGLVG